MVSADGAVRFATFNVSMFRDAEGQLTEDLSTPDNPQAKTNAEIIQRTDPDVVLLNEFDFDANGEAAALFQQNYLAVGQNGAEPMEYPYVYVAPSNTGIASGFDLNNDGVTDTTPGDRSYGDDSLGFGTFPGQYAFALLSKFPIVQEGIRTFQDFLWKDMPGALLPDDPNTPEPNDFYSPEELAVFRLSSKNHIDIPIEVNGEIVHVLASHPTPPVFDGPEDRNGTRNFDEIRFWADYVTPGQGDYIYDDQGNLGGLPAGANFVIMGDQNADPLDGDSLPGAIQQLLENPLVNTEITPFSEGGVEQTLLQGGINLTQEANPAFDTADFGESPFGPGNLRVDYVLPSETLEYLDASVFWPTTDDPLFPLVGTFDPSFRNGFPSSDHRLVWAEVDTAQRFDGTGGQNTFAISAGDTYRVLGFGGVGTGTNPSAETLAEVDTLQFTGAGLTAENLLLKQDSNDLILSFDGTGDLAVRLQDFALQDLENLRQATGAAVDVGNILFDGDTEIQDTFDVVDADQNPLQVFQGNSVTFLNDLDNNTRGFDDSDDVINGQGGDDTLRGLSGDDILRGGDGDDFLDGGPGADFLYGDSGNDELIGDFSDQLFGEEGNDILDTSAGQGSNELFGGAGDDFIYVGGNDFGFGGFGNDLLDASLGSGDNLLFGGEGDDTLYAGFNDQVSGGAGADVLDATSGTGNNDLSGGEGDDILYAFSNDSLSGDEGNDLLDASFGIGGNELAGGEGNDTLYAGVSDVLLGDEGDDILYAGAGGSTLTGGEGADQFWMVYQGLSAAVNTIADFEVGTDVIGIEGLAGVAGFGDLTFVQSGSGTLIRALDTNLAVLTGIENTALDSSSFSFA